MRQSRFRRLHEAILAVAVAAGFGGLPNLTAQVRAGPPPAAPTVPPAPATAQTLHVMRNVPGDSTPVIVGADDAATWTENGQRIVLVRGQVLIQQGVLQLRAREAVVFFGLQGGISHVDVYAEGDVQLDNSSAVQSGALALASLSTRGEFRLRAYKNKVRQQSLADDPLVKRARIERGAPAPPSAGAPPQPAPSAVGKPTADAGWVQPPKPPPPVVQAGYEETQAGPPPAAVNAPPAPGSLAPAPVFEPLPPAPGPLPLPPPSQPGTRPPPSPAPPGGPPRQFSVAPRGAQGFDIKGEPMANGEQAVIVTGGVLVTVSNVPGVGLLDIEADRLVIWSKGKDSQQLISSLQNSQTQGASELEFYLAGNVEIRQTDNTPQGQEMRILRADEVYYDINHNIAVALSALLQIKKPGQPDDVYMRSDELLQVAANKYQTLRSEVFSSKLPSDPGLKVFITNTKVEDKVVPKLGLFGAPIVNRATGRQENREQTLIEGRDTYFELENVPFFYLPYFAGDARDPLGPIRSLTLGDNTQFGFQFGVGLDVYGLLGVDPYEGTRWTADLDYLSRRGPALDSDFDFSGKDLYGLPATYVGEIRGDAMYDQARDILGGNRENDLGSFNPDAFRGRFIARDNVYDLPYGFSVQGQLYALSDRNYLEQYYINEFQNSPNPDTYLYVKQQLDHENWAWTGYVEPRLRAWVNETESLPRADGYLIGESFLDRITYNAWASGGYYDLRIDPDRPTVSVTDQNDATGRFFVMQEASAPFAAGPVKVVPYAKLLLADYTSDLQGDDVGRVWGGGGVRASIPFTRLYPDVQSELFNLNGIDHKIVASADYFVAGTNVSYAKLPQLDRLNDDVTDQALRDLQFSNFGNNPMAPAYGLTNPMFDPQLYAIRKLVGNQIDTLDNIDELNLDIRQRLQTKRGYPGDQHIVDYMTLDTSVTLFPAPNRDNFGEPFGFLQYDYVWNIGDRTAITSSGWYEPGDGAPRVFTVGAFLNRPDRTSFYLGYRQIDPIDSRAVTGAVTYIFSPKYAMTASSTYDFGNGQALSNSVVFTRMGADLQISVGFTYNALTSSFGGVFEIVPNLVPANKRTGPLAALGGGGLLGH